MSRYATLTRHESHKQRRHHAIFMKSKTVRAESAAANERLWLRERTSLDADLINVVLHGFPITNTHYHSNRTRTRASRGRFRIESVRHPRAPYRRGKHHLEESQA
jgi:hypothetical protein